eukprot:951698-Pelagomonas_calceolata.AAC.5
MAPQEKRWWRSVAHTVLAPHHRAALTLSAPHCVGTSSKSSVDAQWPTLCWCLTGTREPEHTL